MGRGSRRGSPSRLAVGHRSRRQGQRGRLRPRQFRTTIQAAASLREALDAVVNTRNQAAVVLDGDRYLGMVFLDQISEGLLA